MIHKIIEVEWKMKMIFVSIGIAIIIGVTIMLLPALVFSYYYPIGIPENNQGLLGRQENNDITTFEQEIMDNKSSVLPTLDKVAQAYGSLNTGTASFPYSLLHIVFVIASGFVGAFVIYLIFRTKL